MAFRALFCEKPKGSLRQRVERVERMFVTQLRAEMLTQHQREGRGNAKYQWVVGK